MKFLHLDISTVICDTPNTFDIAELTAAAEAINELGMLAYPIIAQQTGLFTFQVVGNEFYYYAVLRAIELGGRHELISSMVSEMRQYVPASRQGAHECKYTPEQEVAIATKQQKLQVKVVSVTPAAPELSDSEKECIAAKPELTDAQMECIAHAADIRKAATPTVRKYKTREEELKAKLGLK